MVHHPAIQNENKDHPRGNAPRPRSGSSPPHHAKKIDVSAGKVRLIIHNYAPLCKPARASLIVSFQVVYRQYASLFFICEIGEDDNELLTLEIIHRYVEVLDSYFGNVCELDLIFNFDRAYSILDELVIAGELHESNKKTVLTVAASMEVGEHDEDLREALRETFFA
ncbi:hypothetical protein H0H87_011006 [Tephrocybe sp. NHM501043]|nr:hypothetical protein H0H87_011006 [Tephrocybe sp. NHM501043]